MSPKISLPRGVHRIVSRGREYFYYQEARGTPQAGERVRLPDNPQSPEFWNAIRQVQGICGPVPTDTVGALIDAYEASWPNARRKLAQSTQEQYRRHLKIVRAAWGDLNASNLRPVHVEALIEKIGAERPGTANNTLDALRAMCRWAMGPRDLLHHDPTLGVAHFEKGEGHLPWTPEQMKFAEDTFTGTLRKAYFLARYTGQRQSDLVRLGPTDEDEGGFSLRQKKTGVRPWCPIFPELEAEMRTWEKRPGPYLLQDEGKNAGKPVTTNQLWKIFDRARQEYPILAGAVFHGLRANAAISLRAYGFSHGQISDVVGMSVETVEHYCRHADRKASGKVVLREYQERKQDKTVKHWKTGKEK